MIKGMVHCDIVLLKIFQWNWPWASVVGNWSMHWCLCPDGPLAFIQICQYSSCVVPLETLGPPATVAPPLPWLSSSHMCWQGSSGRIWLESVVFVFQQSSVGAMMAIGGWKLNKRAHTSTLQHLKSYLCWLMHRIFKKQKNKTNLYFYMYKIYIIHIHIHIILTLRLTWISLA